MTGRYQVGLGTTDGMTSAIIGAIDRGEGLDWLDRYPAMIQSLSLERVNGAIRRYLDPQQMVTVEAGTFKK